MANIMQLLPELEGDEMVYVHGLLKDFSDQNAQQFAMMYRARRKDPQTILLTTLVGFLGIAGVQRFEHQHQWEALLACDLLFGDVANHGGGEAEGETHGKLRELACRFALGESLAIQGSFERDKASDR